MKAKHYIVQIVGFEGEDASRRREPMTIDKTAAEKALERVQTTQTAF